jgi:hypothetical protein
MQKEVSGKIATKHRILKRFRGRRMCLTGFHNSKCLNPRNVWRGPTTQNSCVNFHTMAFRDFLCFLFIRMCPCVRLWGRGVWCDKHWCSCWWHYAWCVGWGRGGVCKKEKQMMATANICVNKHNCVFAEVASNRIRKGQFQEYAKQCCKYLRTVDRGGVIESNFLSSAPRFPKEQWFLGDSEALPLYRRVRKIAKSDF